jgi:hypothetical protein
MPRGTPEISGIFAILRFQPESLFIPRGTSGISANSAILRFQPESDFSSKREAVTVGRVSTARLLGMCGNHG